MYNKWSQIESSSICGYAHSKDEETKDPASEIGLKEPREPGAEPGAS